MSKRGWSARQLAERSGLSIGAVLTLTQGRGNPTLSTMLALVSCFELTGIELLLGDLPTQGFIRPVTSTSN